MAGYNDWNSPRIHTWPCSIRHIYEWSCLRDKTYQPIELCSWQTYFLCRYGSFDSPRNQKLWLIINVDKWFLENDTSRKHCKFQTMVMGHRKVNPEVRCENNIIPKSNALQMLGVTVNDMLKFDRLQFSCFRIIRKNIYVSFIVPPVA